MLKAEAVAALGDSGLAGSCWYVCHELIHCIIWISVGNAGRFSQSLTPVLVHYALSSSWKQPLTKCWNIWLHLWVCIPWARTGAGLNVSVLVLHKVSQCSTNGLCRLCMDSLMIMTVWQTALSACCWKNRIVTIWWSKTEDCRSTVGPLTSALNSWIRLVFGYQIVPVILLIPLRAGKLLLKVRGTWVTWSSQMHVTCLNQKMKYSDLPLFKPVDSLFPIYSSWWGTYFPALPPQSPIKISWTRPGNISSLPAHAVLLFVSSGRVW